VEGGREGKGRIECPSSSELKRKKKEERKEKNKIKKTRKRKRKGRREGHNFFLRGGLEL